MKSSFCFAANLGVAAASGSLEEIVAIVNSKQSSWVAAVPSKFGSVDDVKPYLGAYLPGDAEYFTPPVKEVQMNEEIPDSFDAREQWPDCSISVINDQSACGSCWAFGSVGSFQDRACIATGKDVRYSPEDTAFCSNAGNGCDGGFSAWDWFKQFGVVTGGKYEDVGKGDTCLPYSLAPCGHHVNASDKYPACGEEYNSPHCPHACTETGYSQAYGTDKLRATDSYSVLGVPQIQTELMTNGPLYVAFQVYADFQTYKSGVYKHTTGKIPLGGHAVELIGWGTEDGEDYWLIKNSWNEEWGDSGLFKIARGVNECGIENAVSGGTIAASPAPPPAPIVCPFSSCFGCLPFCGIQFDCLDAEEGTFHCACDNGTACDGGEANIV